MNFHQSIFGDSLISPFSVLLASEVGGAQEIILPVPEGKNEYKRD